MIVPVAAVLAALAFAVPPGLRFARFVRGPEPVVLLAQAMPTPPPIAAPKQAPKATPAKPAGEAHQLAEQVQRFYEKTADFSASFEQNYKYAAMARTKKSTGTVQVKKPGLMRWDYAKPAEKAFVLDGKALWIWDPEDKSVMVDRNFSSDGLSAAVTFLWGRGKLSDEFEIALATRPELAADGVKVLELTPKKAQAGFTKLFFAVDAASGAVKTSVVHDAQGNENRIAFADVKTNQALPDARFRFEPPKGAKVQEWKR